MRVLPVSAAFAFVAASVLLAPAVPAVQDALLATTWKVPLPNIDVLRGPEPLPRGGGGQAESEGNAPPPPPIVHQTETTIDEAPERIEKGDGFVVQGRVTTLAGEPVPDALVQVFLNETKEEPGYRVAKGRTASDGTYRIEARVPPFMEARRYQIVTNVLDTLRGRDLYLESWSDPPTAVHSDTRVRFFAPERASTSRPIPLEGHVRDATDGPVREAPVVIEVDGVQVATAMTDHSGFFHTEIEIRQPGTRTIRVTYPGSEFYRTSFAERTIVVGGRGHEVLSEPSVYRGEEITLAGRVTDEDAAGIPGVRIRAVVDTLDGGRTIEATTDAAGEWREALAVPKDAVPDRYPVLYEVPDLDLRERRSFAVLAHTSLAIAAPERVPAGEGFEASATLLDDLGEPLGGRRVQFQYPGGSGRGWTDENGTVVFRVESPGSGDGVAEAEFPGDAFHDPAAASASIHVEATLLERLLPWLLPILAALALAAALAWLLRPKGRRAVRRAVAALDRREPVELAIELPDVEADLPDVWGVGERLAVVVRATTPHGAPVAALSFTHEIGTPGRAATEAEGSVRFVVSYADEGVADLRAHFAGDRARRPAEAVRSVRVVDYRRVIEEGFDELRRDLAEAGVEAHDATAPRELERRLLARAPDLSREELDGLLTLFEVSDYSERPVGRREWIRFHRGRRALLAVLRPQEVEPRAP